MDEFTTFTGKNVDEAVNNALLKLQVPSDRLEYEVVEKGSAGLLGFIGARPAVIRARRKPEEQPQPSVSPRPTAVPKERAPRSDRAPEEREIRTAGKTEGKPEGRTERRDNAAPVKKAQQPVEKKAVPDTAKPVSSSPARTEGAGAQPQKEKDAATKPQAKEQVKEQPKAQVQAKPADKEKPAEKPARKPVPRPARTEIVKNAVPAAETEPKVYDEITADSPEFMRDGKNFLDNVFREMGMDIDVQMHYDEENSAVEINLTGENMGLLIGKRGQTLDSLQHLVSLVINRKSEAYLRVKIDTENYRERRKDNLERLARNVASKVKRTRRPASLEPMNPYERRIIHSILQDDKYVFTKSEGEDPFRHVVVFPVKEVGQSRRPGSGRRGGYNRRWDSGREDNAEDIKDVSSEE